MPSPSTDLQFKTIAHDLSCAVYNFSIASEALTHAVTTTLAVFDTISEQANNEQTTFTLPVFLSEMQRTSQIVFEGHEQLKGFCGFLQNDLVATLQNTQHIAYSGVSPNSREAGGEGGKKESKEEQERKERLKSEAEKRDDRAVSVATAVSVLHSLMRSVSDISHRFSGINGEIEKLRKVTPELVTFCSKGFSEFHASVANSPPAPSVASTSFSPSASAARRDSTSAAQPSSTHKKKKVLKKKHSSSSSSSSNLVTPKHQTLTRSLSQQPNQKQHEEEEAEDVDDEEGNNNNNNNNDDLESTNSLVASASSIPSKPLALGEFMRYGGTVENSLSTTTRLELQRVLLNSNSPALIPFDDLLTKHSLPNESALLRAVSMAETGNNNSSATSPSSAAISGSSVKFIAERVFCDVGLDTELGIDLEILRPSSFSSIVDWTTTPESQSSSSSQLKPSFGFKKVSLNGGRGFWFSLFGLFYKSSHSRFAIRQDVFCFDAQQEQEQQRQQTIQVAMMLRQVGSDGVACEFSCGVSSPSGDQIGLAFARIMQKLVLSFEKQDDNNDNKQEEKELIKPAEEQRNSIKKLKEKRSQKLKESEEKRREEEEANSGVLLGSAMKTAKFLATPLTLAADAITGVAKKAGSTALDALQSQQLSFFARHFPQFVSERNEDEVVDIFNCALSETGEPLKQGYMFLQRKRCCFQGTVLDAQFVIEWRDLKGIERRKLSIFDNSIELELFTGDRLFMTSFPNREEAINKIFAVWQGKV